MNTKLSRVLDEITRTEDKIAVWQEHLEELNIRKKQLEDAEIIRSIRSMKLGSREMLAFLETIKNGTADVRQVPSGQRVHQEETENSSVPERGPAEREDKGNEEKD